MGLTESTGETERTAKTEQLVRLVHRELKEIPVSVDITKNSWVNLNLKYSIAKKNLKVYPEKMGVMDLLGNQEVLAPLVHRDNKEFKDWMGR
jgi:hypothetical protein